MVYLSPTESTKEGNLTKLTVGVPDAGEVVSSARKLQQAARSKREAEKLKKQQEQQPRQQAEAKDEKHPLMGKTIFITDTKKYKGRVGIIIDVCESGGVPIFHARLENGTVIDFLQQHQFQLHSATQQRLLKKHPETESQIDYRLWEQIYAINLPECLAAEKELIDRQELLAKKMIEDLPHMWAGQVVDRKRILAKFKDDLNITQQHAINRAVQKCITVTDEQMVRDQNKQSTLPAFRCPPDEARNFAGKQYFALHQPMTVQGPGHVCDYFPCCGTRALKKFVRSWCNLLITIWLVWTFVATIALIDGVVTNQDRWLFSDICNSVGLVCLVPMLLTMQTSIIHVSFRQLDFYLVALDCILYSATQAYLLYDFHWTAVFGILNHLILFSLVLGCDSLLPEMRLKVTIFTSLVKIVSLTSRLIALATDSVYFEKSHTLELVFIVWTVEGQMLSSMLKLLWHAITSLYVMYKMPSGYNFWRVPVYCTDGTPQEGFLARKLSQLYGCFHDTESSAPAPFEYGLSRSRRKTSALIGSSPKSPTWSEDVRHWFPDSWATKKSQELLQNDANLTVLSIYSALGILSTIVWALVGILFGSLFTFEDHSVESFIFEDHSFRYSVENFLIFISLLPICLLTLFTMNAGMVWRLVKKNSSWRYLGNYMVIFLVEALYLRMCNPGGEAAWNCVSLGLIFATRLLTLPLQCVFMDSVDPRIRERFAPYAYFLACAYWFLAMRRFQMLDMCDRIASLSIDVGFVQVDLRWIFAHFSQSLGMSALACLVKCNFFGKHCYVNYQMRMIQTVENTLVNQIDLPPEYEVTWSNSFSIAIVSEYDPEDSRSTGSADSGQLGTPTLPEVTGVHIDVLSESEDWSFPEMFDSGSGPGTTPPGEVTAVKYCNGDTFLSAKHELDESFSENLLVCSRPALDLHESCRRRFSESEDDPSDSEVIVSDGAVADVSHV